MDTTVNVWVDGVVLGIKSFRNKINWHVKVSDVLLICILGILILHPLYVYSMPYKVFNFLLGSNVQIVSSLALGYLIGSLVNHFSLNGLNI